MTFKHYVKRRGGIIANQVTAEFKGLCEQTLEFLGFLHTKERKNTRLYSSPYCTTFPLGPTLILEQSHLRMAEHLARILGTEEDRVNCPFYWKIGACRHGDQCSRNHYKPSSSPTVIIRHVYDNSPVGLAIAEGQEVSDKLADEESDRVEAFYENIFEELSKYGEVRELLICDNIGDHMVGNVYVRYSTEEYAKSALINIRNKGCMGRHVKVELSPVSDFKEAKCRQYIDGCCNRGGYCNFMHIKHVPRCVKDKLTNKMYSTYPEYLSKRRDYRPDDSPVHNHSEGGRDHRDHNHRRDGCYGGESVSCRPTKTQRQSSEERRMMIESWNKQRER